MVSAIFGRSVGDAQESALRVARGEVAVCRVHCDLAVGARSQVGCEGHRVSGWEGSQCDTLTNTVAVTID